jgi:hypothetical protein
MPDWSATDDWFASEDQLDRVRDIIMTRLADDHFQQECRYLLRFWWQLGMSYREVTYEELQEHVTSGKLRVIDQLLRAIDEGSDAIERWCSDYSLLPRVVDRRDELG